MKVGDLVIRKGECPIIGEIVFIYVKRLEPQFIINSFAHDKLVVGWESEYEIYVPVQN